MLSTVLNSEVTIVNNPDPPVKDLAIETNAYLAVQQIKFSQRINIRSDGSSQHR